MMTTGEKLNSTLKSIKPLDKKAMDIATKRQDLLTKPRGSLGELEALSIKIAGIMASPTPTIKHKGIITMAADHGVVSEGITLYPQEVTRQMVMNFINGGAAINVLAKQIGARVIIVDMGVIGGFTGVPQLICRMIDFGTRNMASGPAMSRQQAINAVEAGIDIVEAEFQKGLDIVGTGDMGLGNTTASSAIFATCSGKPVSEVTGRGTGLSDEQLNHKIQVIEKALDINRPDPDDPLDVLSKVGGFEIGGIAGIILGAVKNRIPVVIDGFISTAAAVLAIKMSPMAKDYLIAAHESAESGHKAMLEYLNLKPLLKLNMRLGEGTGAALGISLVEAAVRILNEMATFSEAGVSDIQ
jgi:nicotinate-nucleotide--dimethylbenzimidazole phosphoribosyltransferase